MKSFCAFIFIALAAFMQCAAQSQWSMFGKDRECTSWAKDDPTFAPPFTSREIQLPAPYSTHRDTYVDFFTFVQGRLICSIENDTLWSEICALDPATGAMQWSGSIPLTGGGIGTAGTIAGDIVVQGGQGADAHLVAFDRGTGTVLWDKRFGSMYARQSIADGDRLYVRKDSLLCINVRNGQIIWSRRLSQWPTPGWPVVDDSRLYYSLTDTLFAASKTDGSTVWRSAGGSNEGLCMDATHIYVATSSGTIRAVNKTDGTTVWTHSIPDAKNVAYIYGNGMAIDDTHLVYGVWANKNDVGTLTTLDKATGAVKWTHVFPRAGICQPLLVNSTVYTVNWYAFTLHGFDLETGVQRFVDNSRVYRTHAIVASGSMYVGVMSPDSLGFRIAVFTPNATATDDAPASMAVPTIHALPNPASDHALFTVNLAAEESGVFMLTDFTGRTVAQEQLSRDHSRVEVPVATLPTGVYVYRLLTGSTKSACGKLLIVH
jgi:outer membrane protein assembly factor BamB